MHYRSKQIYTVEQFTDMGVDLYRVNDSYGMTVAILNQEEFEKQYEPIPEVEHHE